MADRTTIAPHLVSFVEATHLESCWNPVDALHALEQAQRAPVPSRLEEDWRRTDPDLFPWDRIGQVDLVATQREITLRAMGRGEAAGIVPLAAAHCNDQCRALQIVPGDDYDAKFLYYHKALAKSPACFRVPRGFRGDPVDLSQIASGPGLACFTTILIVERDAELTLHDRWEIAEAHAPAIGRVEIIVEDGARLNYVQDERCAEGAAMYRRARIQLRNNASLLWCTLTTGAAWHVSRMEVHLNGSGSEAVIKGLFAGSGNARADHRTHQYHAAPRAKSDLMFKTLLAGNSRSVYQGLISVPRQSQKTDAYQQCRNLLLEPGTHADAIPKLEIIADDVRCTHGASMGSVNKDQLFYLQTRGLSRKSAVAAIATGFAEEIIRFVPLEPVQESWREQVRTTVGNMRDEDEK